MAKDVEVFIIIIRLNDMFSFDLNFLIKIKSGPKVALYFYKRVNDYSATV